MPAHGTPSPGDCPPPTRREQRDRTGDDSRATHARRLTLWQAALSVPVRMKIMGIVLGVIFLLASVVTFQVRATIKRIMREELRRRGISVAHDVAGRATDLILTDNLFAIDELIRDRRERDGDVRYVFLVERSGNKVIAHTFGRAFPTDLLDANFVAPGNQPRVALLESEEGLIHDAAVPILQGRLGTVRVGMSEKRVQQRVAATTRFILLITGIVSLVGIGGAYALTAVLTRPIRNLVRVTEAVGRGELDRKAPLWARDEVGRLSAAFNEMTESLAASKKEIDDFTHQLLHRNEELSVLNAVAATVSRSLDPQEILDGALDQVLQTGEIQAGWVFLWDPGGGPLRLAASRGLSQDFVRQEHSRQLDSCVCRDVMATGQVQIVEDMLACQRLDQAVLEREGLKCHASVPLKAMDQVLGVLNVACPKEHRFGPDDLRLLSAMGHQIGIALANARLYEELQNKEAVRRRLLDELIRAQEAERKRVARELHDQVGQSLTALIMALGSAEELVPAGTAPLKEHLAKTRTLLTKVVEETRRLMLDLRPALLDDLGLVPAIRSFAEGRLRPAGVTFRLLVEGPKRKLPSAVDTAVFRVAQEAITNIVRHAQASQATVRLRFQPSAVIMTVEDDGVGYQPRRPGQEPQTFGLIGMEERAALLGGTLQVDGRPGKGTSVRLELPLTAS